MRDLIKNQWFRLKPKVRIPWWQIRKRFIWWNWLRKVEKVLMHELVEKGNGL